MTRTRSALLWSLGERYVGLCISLVTTMILARILSPTEVGVFSLCAAILAVASVVREFGVSEYLVQERDLDNEKLRLAYGVAILTAWPAGLIILLLRQPIAQHYSQPVLADIIAVLTISFFLLPLATPAYALLIREMQFKKILMLHTASSVAGSAISISLALSGFGPISLAWGGVTSMLVQVIGITLVRPKASLLWPRFRGGGRILRFGGFLVSSRVTESITSNAHEFLIAHFLGFASVGLFSRAKGLVDMFHSNVTTAITRVAMPDMAEALRQEKSLIEAFSRGTAVFASIAWAFFGFLALTAPELIQLMFGPQWDAAAPLATMMAISAMPAAFFALSGSVMAAMGRVRERLMVALQWCPVHLGLLFIAMPFGLQAVATVWFLTNAAIAVIFARKMRKLLGAGYRQLFAATLPSVWPAAASSLAAAGVLHAGRAADLHLLPLLLAAALCASGAWLLTAALLKHPAYVECTRLLASLRLKFFPQ